MNRRNMVVGGLGLTTLAGDATAQPSAPRRAPIVLVHGAWHGGWCWSRVKPRLAAAGHPVSSPTLTGLGERRHLISRSVVLDTHIQDVVQHIENEELNDVVLVGHSYGGFVVTGAVELLGARVSHLILLDAFFPLDGETVNTYAGEQATIERNAKAVLDPNWNIPPLGAAAFGVTDKADAAWVDGRTSAQPFGTYAQPIRLPKGVGHLARRSYISCDDPGVAFFEATRNRIKADPSWHFAGLKAPHDAMVTHPQLLSDTLLQLIA